MKRSWLIFTILGVLTAAFSLWWHARQAPLGKTLLRRELATRALGEYLAQSLPGRSVLVFSNPFTQKAGMRRDIVEMEMAGLRGLNRGLGTKLQVEAVVFPELKPEAWTDPSSLVPDSETSTPLSYLVTSEAFDQQYARHPGCELIVSLIGLPAELERTQCWKTPGKPAFALLLPDLQIIGEALTVRQAFETGKLAALVLEKPETPGAVTPPPNQREVFEDHFILVTAKNFDRLRQEYPRLFP